MDAKERLRLYLEQRRELGEEDLVLDQLPVDDVLSILGVATPKVRSRVVTEASPVVQPKEPAAPSDPVQPTPPPEPATRFDSIAPASADWRSALRDAEVTGSDAVVERGAGKSAANMPEKTAATSPQDVPKAASGPEPSLPLSAELPEWLQALALPPGIVVGGARAPQAIHNTPSLSDIEQSIAACTACPLHTTATRPVPGEGNPDADFVCVGEAPGQNEDESGRPFVGPAGQLLDKILGAIELRREDVFICNVLKHRPPGNRNPLPAEVHACRPFLEQQLAVLKPRVILALGTFAAHTLLNTTQSLGALRGQVHWYHGVPLIVTYHPAALLRNEAWKRPTWQDVQLARRIHDASLAANPQ